MKVNISGTFTSGDLNKNRYIVIINDDGEITIEHDWVFRPTNRNLKDFEKFIKKEIRLFLKVSPRDF